MQPKSWEAALLDDEHDAFVKKDRRRSCWSWTQVLSGQSSVWWPGGATSI